MSAVIVVSDDLRSRIVAEVAKMARESRSSLAADVIPEYFDSVIDGVGELIDLTATDDFEIAVIVALARWKKQHGFQFIRRRTRPNALSLSWNKK